LAVPFRKRETVAADTPATRATSWTVTIGVLLESFFMRVGLRYRGGGAAKLVNIHQDMPV
jgi:hypothetical protein